MDAIRIEVSGDRRAGLRFEAFPDALYDALQDEIESLTADLFGMVRAATPEATGKTRSQERMRVFTDPERITGYIDIDGQGTGKGSDYARAAAIEYGAFREHAVAQHRRRLDHFWDQKLNAPIMVLVDAYRRTPRGPEHSFLRGPLSAKRGEIVSRLNAVVEKAAGEADA